jgi:hypothetical protein
MIKTSYAEQIKELHQMDERKDRNAFIYLTREITYSLLQDLMAKAKSVKKHLLELISLHSTSATKEDKEVLEKSLKSLNKANAKEAERNAYAFVLKSRTLPMDRSCLKRADLLRLLSAIEDIRSTTEVYARAILDLEKQLSKKWAASALNRADSKAQAKKVKALRSVLGKAVKVAAEYVYFAEYSEERLGYIFVRMSHQNENQ